MLGPDEGDALGGTDGVLLGAADGVTLGAGVGAMSPRGGLPETASLAASERRTPTMGGGRARRPLEGATMDTSHTLRPSRPSSRRAPRWMYALRAAGDRWSRSSDGVSGVVTARARMASVENESSASSPERRAAGGYPVSIDAESRGRERSHESIPKRITAVHSSALPQPRRARTHARRRDR